jgi:hypothetical protein
MSSPSDTPQSDGQTGDRKVCTVALNFDERHAAVYALAREIEENADLLGEAVRAFKNAPTESAMFRARDVASCARSIAQIVPALDGLASEEAGA